MQDTFHFPIRVYYEDTDTAGLVYYANYFKYAERARTEMLRHFGIEQEALRRQTGLYFVVKNCQAEYVKPARLDDYLNVYAHINNISGASVYFNQEIKKAEDILVKLYFKIVCVDSNGRPQRVPKVLRIKQASTLI